MACSPAPPPISIPKLMPSPKELGNIDVALVLGGGGVRSVAHVGVLSVLKEQRIPIQLIVGSSAGSIIGAMYADNPDPWEIKNTLMGLKRSSLLDPSFLQLMQTPLSLTGPVQGVKLQKFILDNVKARQFESLKIPFIAVATNMSNNHIIQLRSGPIAPAVNASSAFPPIFSPVSMYNQTLVDGCVIAPVPVNVAKTYLPKMVISVDISVKPSEQPLTYALGLLYRALGIAYFELAKLQANTADIAIYPNLANYGTFDNLNEFDHQNMFYQGRRAALKALPAIKRHLKKHGIPLLKKDI